VSLSRDSRQEKKLKAFRLSQFALKQKFERIDFIEDVLLPEIEAMKSGKSVLGLTEGQAFDLVIEADADSDSSTNRDAK
jgi:hypothetical protein